MSVISATVTAATQFVLDATDKVRITYTRLNQLGKPTVSVTLTDSVDTEDLKDGAVEAVKLDSVVLCELPGMEIVVGAESGDDVLVELQLKDLLGADITAQKYVVVWLSATPGGVPAALPDGGYTVDTGDAVQIEAITSGGKGIFLTGADGDLDITFTESGLLTRYINVALGSKLVISASALSWTP